jgi:drug/metabolite transporter (DMT)-like permease
MWVIFSLLSTLCDASADSFSKYILTDKEENHPMAYTGVFFFTVASIATIIYLIFDFDKSDFSSFTNNKALLWLLVSTIGYALAPSIYYRALKKVSASIIIILSTLQGFFVAFLSILITTENFSIYKLMGAILIFIATLFIVKIQEKDNDEATNLKKNQKFIWLMIPCTIFYAFAYLADGVSIDLGYFPPSFYVILNFFLPGILILLINPRSVRAIPIILKSKRTLKLITLNATIMYLSYRFMFLGILKGGDISSVNLIWSSETVIAVVIAVIFLKERHNLTKKIIASVLASLGIYFISLT